MEITLKKASNSHSNFNGVRKLFTLLNKACMHVLVVLVGINNFCWKMFKHLSNGRIGLFFVPVFDPSGKLRQWFCPFRSQRILF
mmetsp:Transcript_7417/g.11080  ORF Transcript_7417/g.11080 Transcript_7417/m.11080 type:complete len:84 (+) Transcript_7417:61-312(+)